MYTEIEKVLVYKYTIVNLDGRERSDIPSQKCDEKRPEYPKRGTGENDRFTATDGGDDEFLLGMR